MPEVRESVVESKLMEVETTLLQATGIIDSSCRHCWGRGYEGVIESGPIVCRCVVKRMKGVKVPIKEEVSRRVREGLYDKRVMRG